MLKPLGPNNNPAQSTIVLESEKSEELKDGAMAELIEGESTWVTVPLVTLALVLDRSSAALTLPLPSLGFIFR